MTELLKVGDKIAVDGRYAGWQLHTITKVTPTMYVCGSRRFRHDLAVVGPDRFGPYRGQLLTPEIHRAIRLQNASRRMASFKVTDENLEAVEALLSGSSA